MNRSLPESFDRLVCPAGLRLEWRGHWVHYPDAHVCRHGVPYTRQPGSPYSAARPWDGR